ncbi:MAG TPA: DUF3300 domain-containing protein [Acidobacteriaceae bacterium]
MIFLLPLCQGELVGQQPPPYGQGWSQSDSYGMFERGMYARYEQPGYSQPYLQQRPQSYSDPTYQQQTAVQPLGAEQLEQLVAPIALYPDVLLAQVLTASTYPDQVRYVDQWRQAQGNAPAEDIAAGADAKDWDPSLKALTAFPQVLAQMAGNFQWTSDLGNAYYNQPQDVLGAVQMMRHRAQAAGNLQSTPQEAVSYEQGNIALAPPDPDVVHVPRYDPWSVYGRSVSPYPGFSLLGTVGQFLGSSLLDSSGLGSSAIGSSPITYGLGMLMTVFNHTPWGWLGWGLNWLAQSVLFQHNDYYSHSTTVADWGLPYGGPRAFRGYHGNPGPGFRQGFAREPGGFQEARLPFGRGYQTGRVMYARAPLRAGSVYGRPGSMYRQPENPYSRSGFRQPGYGSYRSPEQGYRGPVASYRGQGFAQRRSFAGGYSGKANRSGGFHLFGGGHPSRGFGGGSHKSNFGGGHGMFGGHSGGHFGGHGGGGGHSHGHHR